MSVQLFKHAGNFLIKNRFAAIYNRINYNLYSTYPVIFGISGSGTSTFAEEINFPEER